MKKVIEVTKNFRIVVDKGQYTIQRLCLIDPRNSPRNRGKENEEFKTREEWKDEGYYSLTNRGLQYALKKIVMLESCLSKTEKTDLQGYINELKEINDDISNKINKALKIK